MTTVKLTEPEYRLLKRALDLLEQESLREPPDLIDANRLLTAISDLRRKMGGAFLKAALLP